MSYELPFKQGHIVELGGDLVRPNFRPNVNSSPGPAVDHIADLNERFPLPDASYDGIYGQYVIEHIRHARVRQFITECYRVLRPGGYCVMVTANLLEQCRRVINTPVWTDELIQMIFAGNPDYPGNYHHTGFSPDWAVKLFSEAGFNAVDIIEHPQTVTDLIIEARK